MKRHRAAALVVVTALSAFGTSAEAPATEAQEAEQLVRELLEITGAAELGVQAMNQMIDAFKQSDPLVAEEFWSEFMAEVDPDELVELVIPIYLEHLTVEEMKAAVEFYRTPAGQTIIRKMPTIMQESMLVGQEWGMEIGRRVAERLEEWKKTHSDA